MKYTDKLKDPRWQRKRLEVLERAGWMCQLCGDTEKTLHVHHPKYKSAAEPWEYTNLIALCEPCHSSLHNRNAPQNKVAKGCSCQDDICRDPESYLLYCLSIDDTLLWVLGLLKREWIQNTQSGGYILGLMNPDCEFHPMDAVAMLPRVPICGCMHYQPRTNALRAVSHIASENADTSEFIEWHDKYAEKYFYGPHRTRDET